MIHFEPFTGWPASWKGEVQVFSIEFSNVQRVAVHPLSIKLN